MIYQVKDNKKIPLGTQFDNSWEIEYNRDLSSQLSGKTEWTATEDCWFQYHSIFYSKSTDTNQTAYTTLTIQLNDIVISNTDNIQDTSGGLLYEIVASVLMKKGDKITYVNTEAGRSAPPFTVKCAKIFPIHRILSKQEPVKTITINITTDSHITSDVNTLETDLLPVGNDTYLVYGRIKLNPVSVFANTKVSLTVDNSYEWVNLVANTIQTNVGSLLIGGGISSSDIHTFNNYIHMTNIDYEIFMYFQGVLTRGNQ